MAGTRGDAPQITVASEPEDSSSAEPSSGRCSNSSSPCEGVSRPEERQSTFSLRSSPIGNVLKDCSSSSMMQFGGGGGESTSPMRLAFLRPSQLTSPEKFGSSPTFGESASKACSAFPLKPARLGNPFALSEEPEQKDDSNVVGAAASSTQSTSPVQPLSMPKFVPLGMPSTQSRPQATPTPVPAPTSSSAVSGFVFGQNLHERVTDTNESGADKPKEAMETTNNGCVASTSNGTTENLFTSVLKREQVDKNNDSGSESGSERPNKSLSEAAREYEEARAVKRKYEEVAVVTGEEDEVNILQGLVIGQNQLTRQISSKYKMVDFFDWTTGRGITLLLRESISSRERVACERKSAVKINCKLFAYDKSKSSWVERGRGNLRLNDKDLGNSRRQSRVIMRATGSLRVVLNTKLWAGMVVEKVSTKSVRLTAQDSSGEILVFLVMASPKDAEALFNYMDARVTTLRTTGSGSSTLPETVTDPEPKSSNSWSDVQPPKKLAADGTNFQDSDTSATNDTSREAPDSGGERFPADDAEMEKKEETSA